MNSTTGAGYTVPIDAGVVTASDESVVWIACLPAGPIHVLEGVAATIWQEATAGRSEGIVGRVAERWGQDPVAVRADVVAFLTDLVERGLLVLTRS